MIITLEPDAAEETLQTVLQVVSHYAGVTPRKYVFQGERHQVIEVHLIGTGPVVRSIPTEVFSSLPGVRGVVRVSTKYRLIGRHGNHEQAVGFQYNGVSFGERAVNIFAGLCA